MPFDHVTAFKEIANGNSDALSCLNALFTWFHAFDDAWDRDKPVLLSWVIASQLRMIECVACNPFFQKHKLKLLPVMEAAALAYVESERFREDKRTLHRIGSQILKSQYQDLFFAVARLEGGDEHWFRMSEKYREFDFDPVPIPNESPK